MVSTIHETACLSCVHISTLMMHLLALQKAKLFGEVFAKFSQPRGGISVPGTRLASFFFKKPFTHLCLFPPPPPPLTKQSGPKKLGVM